MGIGGSFDVLAGKMERAPLWMQKYSLEWLLGSTNNRAVLQECLLYLNLLLK